MTGPSGNARTAAMAPPDAMSARSKTDDCGDGGDPVQVVARALCEVPVEGLLGAAQGKRNASARVRRAAVPVYGALDLGTNNCRLLVARPSRRGFLVIDAFSRIIRLGEGVLRSGRLSDTAMNRTIEALNIGQNVKVQVIRFNPETQRISLGMKQLEADPWEGVDLKYPAGAKFRGRVTNITDYGAFVELEPGVEGLVHVSEMSWTKKNVHPGKIVSTSQEVEVMVLDVDAQKRRISLGLKQTLANPWEAFVDEHPVGTELEGEVRNITEFGLFVGLPGDIDGMVHMSDIDWSRPGEDAINDYRKGDAVRVKVLDIDVEKERISLGIKQLEADPFEAGMTKLKKGDVVTGTISATNDAGIDVLVGDGVPGFIRKSELSRDRSEQRPDRFAIGEKIDAKITAIDRATRKLTLSIKAREVDEEKRAMAEFGSSDSGASLGDILGAAINRARRQEETEEKT